jgi:hypothetical protein
VRCAGSSAVRVDEVHIADDIGLVLGFDEVFGALELQPVARAEFNGPEVARYTVGDVVTVWRTGEPPFGASLA